MVEGYWFRAYHDAFNVVVDTHASDDNEWAVSDTRCSIGGGPLKTCVPFGWLCSSSSWIGPPRAIRVELLLLLLLLLPLSGEMLSLLLLAWSVVDVDQKDCGTELVVVVVQPEDGSGGEESCVLSSSSSSRRNGSLEENEETGILLGIEYIIVLDHKCPSTVGSLHSTTT